MQLNIAEFPVLMLVHIVSDLLESIVQTNDQLKINTPLTHFHSRAKPNITINAYLTRILKFAPFSNEALLSLLVYFDRIATKRQYAINSLNVHRLLITSVVVASKFTSDVYYPNSRYAKVGGLPLLELNQLELEFLFLCDFQLLVPLEDLQEYGNQLLQHAVHKSLPTPPTPTSSTSSLIISEIKGPSVPSSPIPLSSPPLEVQSTIITADLIKKTIQATSTTLSNLKNHHHHKKTTIIKNKDKKKNHNDDIDYDHDLTTMTKSKRKFDSSSLSTVVRKRLCPSPPYTNDVDTKHPPTSKSKQSIDALLH